MAIKQQQCKKCKNFQDIGKKYGWGLCVEHNFKVNGRKKMSTCQKFKMDFIYKK